MGHMVLKCAGYCVVKCKYRIADNGNGRHHGQLINYTIFNGLRLGAIRDDLRKPDPVHIGYQLHMYLHEHHTYRHSRWWYLAERHRNCGHIYSRNRYA